MTLRDVMWVLLHHPRAPPALGVRWDEGHIMHGTRNELFVCSNSFSYVFVAIPNIIIEVLLPDEKVLIFLLLLAIERTQHEMNGKAQTES